MTIQDYGHRSIHLMTLIGKAVVTEFYTQGPGHSFFFGCSTGGRQGLREIQQYPNDYDGVIAGAPVFPLTRLQMRRLWTHPTR